MNLQGVAALVLGLWSGALAAPAPGTGQGGTGVPGERAGPGALSSRSDYRIAARLDAAQEGFRLRGELTLTWTNGSRDAVSELWFHLYHNAFANNRSTHLASTGGRIGGDRVEDGWGWQRVQALSVGGTDLMPSFRYRTAPDGTPEDLTVFSVELPAPVQAGGSIEVELTWTAQVPRLRRRSGWHGDFLLMAHWFPKLGVYESGRGWNCHPFYSNTEFFADYGTYDVTLDLPAAYAGEGTDLKVGASGVEIGPARKEGERVVKRFVAPSERDQRAADRTGKAPLVHGFAWTADPDFATHGETFHFDDWAARYPAEVELARRAFGPDADLRLRDVDVKLLLQPERASQAARHIDATCAALFFYGLWYGEYPYERITVVDPAWGANAAGGMEYPTLFTCGTRLFTFPAMHSPESVTVHECGHQFWYGLVGNNEFEAAWLDEGLNSYTDSEVLWRRYGWRHRTTDFARVPFDGIPPTSRPGEGERVGLAAQVLSGRRWPIPGTRLTLEPLRPSGFVDWWRDQPLLSFTRQRDDPRWHDRVRYLSDPDTDPVDTPGWRYADRTSYSINSYPRTAVVLRTLEGLIGREAFLRGMRAYATRWRYAHPYPDDFIDAFVEGSGVDVRWYLEETLRGTGTVDWSVEVEQRRVPAVRGWFQPEPGAPFGEAEVPGEVAALEEAAEERPVLAPEDDPGDERAWEVDLVLRRRGALSLPLEVELTWSDGETRRVVWSRAEQQASSWQRPLGRWARSQAKLVSVVLDPERRYFIDLDLSDNQWFAEKDERAPLRWAERAFTQYAQLLHWFGGIGG
jgi:hypothetical protein